MITFGILIPIIDPIAIQIGPIDIYWYGLSYGLGLIFGWIYISSKFIRYVSADRYVGTEAISNFLPWIIFGVILGGRIGYIFIYDPSYFLKNLDEIYKIWNGGMSFHGGLIGVILSTILFSRKNKLNFLSLTDLLAIAAPIGIFFGRISNFINYELIGTPSNLPWSIIYPTGELISRHPSQIYEAILEGLFLFLILFFACKKFLILRTPGKASGIFLIFYGLFRIISEIYRMPDEQIGYIFGQISLGMLISLPMMIVGIILLKRLNG
tara:strand:+ start:1268 stop:2068 length:801 start_codon:yes stop_codon:yes gene_type:complete